MKDLDYQDDGRQKRDNRLLNKNLLHLLQIDYIENLESIFLIFGML